jgi:hypothetical protein
MNILVLQPGFPAEIPYYVRGLARRGARVLGVGDMPASALPAAAREGLFAYLQVSRFWDSRELVAALRGWALPVRLDGVECLWEPAMELAAHVRAAFGLPGPDVAHARRFRDKHMMRNLLEQAGIRQPRHARARTQAEVFAAAEHVGFPLIIKPVAGAGSADTYRVDDARELERIEPALRHIPEVVLEEFVEGDEFTFDTICADGKILFHSILRYRPTMLESRSLEWVSPQNMILRDLDAPVYRAAYSLGESVLAALDRGTGFSHMEWKLTPRGEVVFLEIAARPPGGMTGELINYSCDFDIYEHWAEAVLRGRPLEPWSRKYNVAMIFKRAQGHGRIRKIVGVDELEHRFGKHVVRHELLPIGAPRRDWKSTLLSDGFVILRHPDLDAATHMSAWVAENVRLFAG